MKAVGDEEEMVSKEMKGNKEDVKKGLGHEMKNFVEGL